MELMIITDGTGEGTVVTLDGERLDARLVHFKIQVGSGGIVKQLMGDLRVPALPPPEPGCAECEHVAGLHSTPAGTCSVCHCKGFVGPVKP